MGDLNERDAVPESPVFPPALHVETLLHDTGAALNLHKQINERRARIENAELLQNLRAL